MATGVEQRATMDVETFKGLPVINGGIGELTANASIAAIQPMSALPPRADMCSAPTHVCFVPKAGSITLSARARSDGGTVRPSAEIAISSWTEVQLYHTRGNPKLAEPRKKRLKKRR